MASSAGVLSEMIAAGCGPVVKMWAPSDPHKAIKLNKGTSVYCLDFSHNNKVLAVGGESGQATLYSMKGASIAAGALEVGQIPRTPEETVDSFTCMKFAPNDSYIVGGCTNGQVHLWNLKGTEPESSLEPLSGSVTSVAVNALHTLVAASGSSGQVVLCHFPSGRKAKTLLQRGGPRASCLGFSGSNLLCGAKSSGQLMVWDVTQSSQLAEEFNVHRKIVTGCTFAPNDDNLLVSCGEDGLLACTDRRTKQVAWEYQLRSQPLSSVTMRWDGSMVAVGTGSGRVQVHDTRNISSTLSTQEFTSEQPVTALCWQHMPNKQHKRNSLGATSAAAHTTAGSSDSAAQSSQSHAVASGAKGLTTAAAASGARSSAGDSGDGAAAQLPQKTPLVVYGREGATPQTALTSSERDIGMRVVSPMRMYSPLDSDINSAGPGVPAAAAAHMALHTPDAVGAALHTPADSAASGPGYRGPAMFTPGLGYLGAQGVGGITPFGGLTTDVTPVSRLADSAAAAAAAAEPVRERRAGAAAAAQGSSTFGRAAADSRGPEGIQRGSAGGANAAAAAGKAPVVAAVASKFSDSIVPPPAAAAAKGGRSTGGGGAVPSSTSVEASAAAGSHRRKVSDTSAAAAADTAATGVNSRSRGRPGPAAADNRGVLDNGAADAAGLVSAKGAAEAAVSTGGLKAAAISSGGMAAAIQQQVSSSSQPAAAAAALTAAGVAGAMGLTGSALREDVFKAYVDKRMNALEATVTNLHMDLNRRFEEAQADLTLVVTSLAARQDQLAEAITQLTVAVQGLSANKLQQQQQQQQFPLPGVSIIPWI